MKLDRLAPFITLLVPTLHLCTFHPFANPPLYTAITFETFIKIKFSLFYLELTCVVNNVSNPKVSNSNHLGVGALQ